MLVYQRVVYFMILDNNNSKPRIWFIHLRFWTSINNGLSGLKCHWGMYVLFIFKDPKVTNVSLQNFRALNEGSGNLYHKPTEDHWNSIIFQVLLMEKKNPAPVEVGSLSHYLQGFSTIPGGFLAGFLVAINRMSSILESQTKKKSMDLP